MPDRPTSMSKMFKRYSIAFVLVLLFMGIFFEPIAGLIIKRRVLELMLLLAIGFVSTLIGFVVIKGIEWTKEGKGFSLELYIWFSSGLSLVFLWGITLIWTKMLRVALSLP